MMKRLGFELLGAAVVLTVAFAAIAAFVAIAATL